MEDKLNFVLLGKTGEGKSATGNSLLNRRYFKTSISATQETMTVNYNFGLLGTYTLLVVDGPGLIAVTSKVEDKTGEKKIIIDEALDMCYRGVDAFLLVIKFISKMTEEDKSALEALKQTLGDRYLDHVIVVLTYGDFYQSQVEDEEGDISFDEWCRKQTGEFRQLYEDCEGRFVLFNNKEKDEEKKQAQVQKVVQMTLGLREKHGRYTRQCLKDVESSFEKSVTESKATELVLERKKAPELVVKSIAPELTVKSKALEKVKEVKQQTMNQQKQIKMEDVKLNFLLLGKTGQGKSATGNTILQRRAFTAKASTTSVTKEIDFNFSRFGRYVLLVVDGPGLADTDINRTKETDAIQHAEEVSMKRAQEMEDVSNKMNIALAMCYGGVDAFLYVIKLGSRFTAEDKYTLEVLKQIFGDTYLNHVIVVVTCGDLYQGAMEEEKCDDNFHDWCRKQSGEFRQLYQDCEGRFVLFNNREKDEEKKRAQIQEIVQLAHDLQESNGRYTSKCFQDAETEREKTILELKMPQLTREIQEKICLLTADIENLSKEPSDIEKEKIRADIQDLRREIEVHDKGYGELKDLREQVDDLEGSLDDVDKLKSLANQLENTRDSSDFWASLLAKVVLLNPIGLVAMTIYGGFIIAKTILFDSDNDDNTEKKLTKQDGTKEHKTTD